MKRTASAEDPLWYKDAIIYELHVKAFYDSNNDGIGDFGGLIQKLDYLQELGVTCLWLLPFFPSPLRDDGYDIADYRSIHPSYGSMEDFKAFLNAAHDRGMQVMIELVVNHTSDQHPWFQAARMAPPGSPERDYYVWSDTDQRYQQARIIFTDTEKSNWTWDPEAKAYFWHRFFSHQPDLNFDNPRVVEEVIQVMRYWLDMGVDALRLDAIPYLVEREGTNCENLPETHAVIRQIRRALDEHYANRMILAEANQWPTDVRAYFGDGDECHMAFHFPLMPRLFMALRLEDRHPITEIMAQTPEIPDVCQWGLFLRNHDELTLEMVTDEERDYMYLAYSADPRMRINIGIRRRLAPLMDNNRRRIELLNSILFSFRGTPILYYGDEIGMGDNIYLGDRNGVRTPMQWSADRNAGFSRANPQKLYSPVIMDPVYGYEAVNVEAQLTDHSSLLHWMRNMIALRKLFKVFGRGKLDFLYPSNRKILAYVRSDGDERVLCVANLSRFPQPVELDLSAFAGMVPVEMLGFVEFPEIRKAPYPLTLGPYGFLWFELHPSAPPVEIETMEVSAEQAALATSGSWADLFDGATRTMLESELLPHFLPLQRWFGAKGKTIQRTAIRDWVEFPESNAAIAFVQVDYIEGGSDLYVLPLKMSTEEDGSGIRDNYPGSILAAWVSPAARGVLYDATLDDRFQQDLLEIIAGNRQLNGQNAAIRGIAGKDFPLLRGDEQPLPAVRSTAEQSNTSIRYGGKLILKVFRKLENGVNPDCELTQYLSEKCGFQNVPRFGGLIEFQPDGGGSSTLALLQQMVENQGDGWEWTLEDLGRYYERWAAIDAPQAVKDWATLSLRKFCEEPLPPDAEDVIGLYVEAAATLARRTAEMHLALVSDTSDEAFRPEKITPNDLAVLADALHAHATEVFEVLRNNLSKVPDEYMEAAGRVLSHRRSLLSRFQGLDKLEVDISKSRIHGDYHLGQLLRVGNDWVILDFEGEPARPLSERRAKQSPLKDVAGMLRSFSYAAQAAFLNHTARRPHDAEKLEVWSSFWEKTICGEFLRRYRETVANHYIVPQEPGAFWTLLDAFVLDKAVYELNYEINNRPAWMKIPLAGILALCLER
jgi:maltose alpha-D-glucosyltransferase/alpha-amylase